MRAKWGEARKWLHDHADFSSDECLIWPFSRSHNGYARVVVMEEMRWTTASRYMCEIVHGKDNGDGKYAMHSCDNGKLGCVNPKHLSWGTALENWLDFGRSAKWKFTPEQIRQIRMMAANHTYADIGRKFGASDVMIRRICKRLSYSWVD